MGLITGVISFFLKWGLYVTLFILAVAFIPNLPPYTKFTSYDIKPVQDKYKTLDHCVSLNNAKRVLEGKVHGPESFRIVNGELVTTLGTGEVVKLSHTGDVNIVTKIGGPCSGEWEEEICGRPLATQFDEKNGKLYVLDSYHGIWKVDLKSDKKQLLVSPRKKLEGSEPKLFNSFAFDHQSGDIYWTESSNDYTLKDGFIAALSDPSGRLFHYDSVKNHSTVLMGKLAFPNGVALSPNRDFVVVAESFKLRLLKYYVNGPYKGKKEVFVDGLPGNPDNIQTLPDGSGILVGMYVVGDSEHPLLTTKLAATPIIRKFLARLMRMIELPIQFLNHHFHHVVFDKILYNVGNFKTVAPFASPLSGLVRVDWNGNIVQCYVNSDNSVGTISDGIVHNDLLYLGSPHSPYLGTVPAPKDLIDAFKAKPNKAAQAKKLEEQKVTPSPAAASQKTAQAKQAAPAKPVESKPVENKPSQPTEPKQARPAAQKEKPVVAKSEEPKTSQGSKPAPTKPKPTEPKPAETKKTTQPNPTEAKPKPAEAKKAAQPNPTEAKPKVAEAKKASNAKPETPKGEFKQKNDARKETPEQIPIKEDIPSDTAKPNKETLKVIKKSGPAEIPNPVV